MCAKSRNWHRLQAIDSIDQFSMIIHLPVSMLAFCVCTHLFTYHVVGCVSTSKLQRRTNIKIRYVLVYCASCSCYYQAVQRCATEWIISTETKNNEWTMCCLHSQFQCSSENSPLHLYSRSTKQPTVKQNSELSRPHVFIGDYESMASSLWSECRMMSLYLHIVDWKIWFREKRNCIALSQTGCTRNLCASVDWKSTWTLRRKHSAPFLRKAIRFHLLLPEHSALVSCIHCAI